MRPIRIIAQLANTTMLVFALAAPLAGQWRSEPSLPVSQPTFLIDDPPALRLDSVRPKQANDGTLALAGVAGAAIGSIGGAYLGYQLDYEYFNWGCEHGCEDPGLWGLLGGWFVGSAVITPLSVHLANDGRGSLPAAYLSSALIAGVGMAGLLGADSPEGVFVLLGTPLAQAVSAVLIERKATR